MGAAQGFALNDTRDVVRRFTLVLHAMHFQYLCRSAYVPALRHPSQEGNEVLTNSWIVDMERLKPFNTIWAALMDAGLPKQVEQAFEDAADVGHYDLFATFGYGGSDEAMQPLQALDEQRWAELAGLHDVMTLMVEAEVVAMEEVRNGTKLVGGVGEGDAAEGQEDVVQVHYVEVLAEEEGAEGTVFIDTARDAGGGRGATAMGRNGEVDAHFRLPSQAYHPGVPFIPQALCKAFSDACFALDTGRSMRHKVRQIVARVCDVSDAIFAEHLQDAHDEADPGLSLWQKVCAHPRDALPATATPVIVSCAEGSSDARRYIH